MGEGANAQRWFWGCVWLHGNPFGTACSHVVWDNPLGNRVLHFCSITVNGSNKSVSRWVKEIDSWHYRYCHLPNCRYCGGVYFQHKWYLHKNSIFSRKKTAITSDFRCWRNNSCALLMPSQTIKKNPRAHLAHAIPYFFSSVLWGSGVRIRCHRFYKSNCLNSSSIGFRTYIIKNV